MSKINKLAHMCHHIDNGGVTLTVNESTDDNQILGVQIELETSYFGYPSVKSTLNLWGHYGTKDILREMGEALIMASEKMTELSDSDEWDDFPREFPMDDYSGKK